jgi:hypothetical protein
MNPPTLIDLKTIPAMPNKVLFDAFNRLQSIALLTNKVVRTFNANDTLDKLKGAAQPGAGIVYEGLRAVGEGNQPSARIGNHTELGFMIIISNAPDTLFNADTKTPTIDLLNQVRAAFMGHKSPTGHFYRFVVEAQAVETKGAVVWVQRWATPYTASVGAIAP